MADRLLTGQQKWEGYHPLCKPMQIMGIDRKAFILIAVFGFAIWQALSVLIGVGVGLGLYLVIKRWSKADPQFLNVLVSASRHPGAWYDPAWVPQKLGPFVVDDPAHHARIEALDAEWRRSSAAFVAGRVPSVDDPASRPGLLASAAASVAGLFRARPPEASAEVGDADGDDSDPEASGFADPVDVSAPAAGSDGGAGFSSGGEAAAASSSREAGAARAG